MISTIVDMKKQLLNDLKEAMKEKDVIKKNTIQLIRASILKYEKDNLKEADDNKIIDIIFKIRRTLSDALKDFEKSGRQDLIDETNKEIEILDNYLPTQLNDNELFFEILKIINEVNAQSVKDLGMVIKAAKSQIGNQADGKRISMAAKELLNQKQKELNEKISN